jgi:site-specific recombinase XerD
MLLENRIFDTIVDTRNRFVSVKTTVVKRNYINAKGESLLYLFVTNSGKRERIPLDIYVPAHLWIKKNQRLNPVNQHCRDLNLILDNIDSKVTSIHTLFRLSNKQLSLEKFCEEFRNSIPRLDFLAFIEYQLAEEKNILRKGTLRRHQAVLEKLRRFRKEIFFTELDENMLTKIRSCFKGLGNASVTIESNMASIKKFVTAAEKKGIKMLITSSDIKVGSTSGNRTNLSPGEIFKIFEFFNSQFINPRYKLVAGYFLFSCFTGLRISDVQNLTRAQVDKINFTFITQKTTKLQHVSVSKKVREILEEDKRLFVKKVSNEEMNRVLKLIATLCGIKKKVSFHVARHSFATNFLRMGGDVQTLQSLLGHSKITETMIYVHIVNAEACEKMKLMDNLF